MTTKVVIAQPISPEGIGDLITSGIQKVRFLVFQWKGTKDKPLFFFLCDYKNFYSFILGFGPTATREPSAQEKTNLLMAKLTLVTSDFQYKLCTDSRYQSFFSPPSE